MTAKVAVSLEEYLSTGYEFDPEYVDGEIVERPVPTISHARTQNRIGAAFEAASAARLFAAPQVRIRTRTERYRVPDIPIFADSVPRGRYPQDPPFAVIEILSPDDSQAELIDKLDEYTDLNISYVWVVDPVHRRVYRYHNGSLLQQDSLAVPERGLRLMLQTIFGDPA